MLKRFILFIINNLFPSFLFKTRKKKIVADSFLGKPFSGNAKYIIERLLELDTSLDIVWLSLDKNIEVPKGVRVVKYNSLQSVYEMATAKIWIDDFRKKYFPKKKKEQYYFQTWHGFITLKHVEKDIISSLSKEYLKEAIRDGKNSDYMVSGSKTSTGLYKSSFWFDGEVLEFGTPRMDAIIMPNKHVAETVDHKLGLNKDDNVFLYAPTFRDDDKESVSIYDINFKQIKLILERKFGGHWKILLKLHPNISDLEKRLINQNNSLIAASNYEDIQELILRSKFVMTDYSSLMFDAMMADKNVLLYTPDLATYQSNRGFYFKMEDLPFPLFKTEQDLKLGIEYFDYNSYFSSTRKFINDLGIHEDGHAAERTAKYILKKMYE